MAPDWGKAMSEKRVCFDFEVDFSNGGGIQGQDFRLDIDGDDIADDALAARSEHYRCRGALEEGPEGVSR